METTTKNYVLDAANAYYRKDGKNAEVLKYHADAVERFTFIHVLYGMAHTESLKAIDMIDDNGMRRFILKKHLKEYEGRFEQYEHFMNTHMERSSWLLLQDYVRVCCTKIESRLLMLKIACQDYLNKLKKPKAELLGQCESALLMWDIAVSTFDAYFGMYKEKCGIDFSNDFKYADMRRCYHTWLKITDELARGVKGVDFGDDKRCSDCWVALKNTLNNVKFFDEGALQALVLNENLLEKYKNEIDSLKKEAATA